jgi:hypothetical protein
MIGPGYTCTGMVERTGEDPEDDEPRRRAS